MIYFQPETALKDLGLDGSSPVSSSILLQLCNRVKEVLYDLGTS
jgi:hypothetical protein